MTFSVKIGPLTAAVLAAAALAGSAATSAVAAAPSAASSQAAASPQADNANSATTNGGGITYCQAGKTATGKFGGTVKSVSSDHYRGTPVWEVELRDSRRGNIEVKISKASGSILHVEQD